MTISLDDVADFYSYFYSKKYKNQKYKLRYTEWSLKIATKFLELFTSHFESPDRRLLWNYCVFQFNLRWDQELKGHNGDGRIHFNVIFSEKDFFNFYERNTKHDWQFTDAEIIKKYNLKFNDISESSIIRVDSEYDYEEKLKKKFKEENTLLTSCLDFTTLYKPDSKICNDCEFKNDCIVILKDNFPQLHKARINALEDGSDS